MTQSCIRLEQHHKLTNQQTVLDHLNQNFDQLDALQRVELAAKYLPEQFAMTSSFGIDSAVSLHLLNQVIPNIPVILIDTGYLFKETYQYIEQLRSQLKLNLHIHQSDVSAARFEGLHGQLWTQGLEGLEQYNQIRKVQPLEAALKKLKINSWFSGIRRNQSTTRQNMDWAVLKNQRHKVHPLLDWSDRDMYMYQQKHKLPQHPLRDQGYLSVGDTHSTRSIHEVDSIDELRFFGLKRECGIHE